MPVLVVEENGERLVLNDENDIHAYLDRRIGPMPERDVPKPPADATEQLRREAPRWSEMSEWLLALAQSARAAGRLDEANCLRIAGLHLGDASRWAGDHLPEEN